MTLIDWGKRRMGKTYMVKGLQSRHLGQGPLPEFPGQMGGMVGKRNKGKLKLLKYFSSSGQVWFGDGLGSGVGHDGQAFLWQLVESKYALERYFIQGCSGKSGDILAESCMNTTPPKMTLEFYCKTPNA